MRIGYLLGFFSAWASRLAYLLAGAEGYRRVEKSDKRHVAPGAETIRELFGGEPTLIMIDEVSVYLRKVERAYPGASGQFTAFLHALFKAVETAPNVALVFTLAVARTPRPRTPTGRNTNEPWLSGRSGNGGFPQGHPAQPHGRGRNRRRPPSPPIRRGRPNRR